MDANQDRFGLPRRRVNVGRRLVWLCAVGSLLTMLHPCAAGEMASSYALSGLTAQQQQKLSALETSSGDKAKELFAQIDQIRGKLFNLYQVYQLDTAAAAHWNQQLNHVQRQLLDLRLSEQRQLRAILSAAQFAQLQAAMHQHDDWDRHHSDADHDGDHHSFREHRL